MAKLSLEALFNLGDWSEADTFAEATRALVFRLAEFADLEDGQHVLDVGVGSGEQVRMLAERYALTLEGIDPNLDAGADADWSPSIRERTHLRRGVGEKLEATFSSCDRVLALDCAYHFRTREDFFKQAHDALKPGGVLAAFDLAFKQAPSRWLSPLTFMAGVPRENRWLSEEVKRALSKHGFVNITVEVIDDDVWPGLLNYAKSHPSAFGQSRLQRAKFAFTMKALRCYKSAESFPLNALLYRAQKPLRLV